MSRIMPYQTCSYCHRAFTTNNSTKKHEALCTKNPEYRRSHQSQYVSIKELAHKNHKLTDMMMR